MTKRWQVSTPPNGAAEPSRGSRGRPVDVPPCLKLYGGLVREASATHVTGGRDVNGDRLADLPMGAPRRGTLPRARRPRAANWARPSPWMWVAPLLAALGCMDDESAPKDAPGDVSITCDAHPTNALRAVCTVSADPPSDVTLTWGPAGAAPEQSKSVSAVADGTEVTLLWFAPRAAHDIVATRASGETATTEFMTGDVADSVATTYQIEGQSTARRILNETRCQDSGMVVISATDGRLLWYQDFALGEPSQETKSVNLTPEGTLIAYGDEAVAEPEDGPPGAWIREMDLYGNLLFEARQYEAFDHGIHHETTKHDGHYYSLFAEVFPYQGTDYLVDGFLVLDGGGATVAEWRLMDHLDPSEAFRPGVFREFSHANSIMVDEFGNVLISFRHLSAVAYVAGDWNAPNFGEILWWLAGDPGTHNQYSTWDVTSSVGAPKGFAFQHHAALEPLPPGADPDTAIRRLTVFDNQPLGVPSRLTEVRLDAVTGVADIVPLHTLDRHCDYQGAFYTTADNRAYGTCSSNAGLYEFELGMTLPSAELSQACLLGNDDAVFRVIPIDDALIANGELLPR